MCYDDTIITKTTIIVHHLPTSRGIYPVTALTFPATALFPQMRYISKAYKRMALR
jgi:hypothetical protein